MKRVIELSILLIFFFTPLESVPILEDFSVVKLISIIFFLSCLIGFGNLRIYNNNFIQIILVYTLLCFLSLLWSIDIKSTLFSFLGTVLPTSLLTILLLFTIKDINLLNKALVAYIAGTTILCLYAFIDYSSIISAAAYADQFRIKALGQDQNEMAFLINMGIVFCLYLIYFKKKKFLNYTLIGIFSFIGLSTGSRTGFVVMILILFIWLLSFRRKYFFPSIIGMAVLIFIVFQFIPEEITERLFETKQQITSNNLTGRGYIWAKSLQAFDNSGRYLIGTGWGTFIPFLKSTQGYAAAPHNTYLTFLIELGILGLATFLIMIYSLMKKCILLSRISYIYMLFILPLILTMLTLGTSNRRWFFILAVVIIKLVEYNFPSSVNLKYRLS